MCGWLVLVGVAFYWFFWRFIRPFDQLPLYPQGEVNRGELAVFLRQQLQEPLSMIGDNNIEWVVYHWIDPDCRCVLFSGETIIQLVDQNQDPRITHIVLTLPGKTEQLRQLLPMLDNVTVVSLSTSAYQASRHWIPSTPAALVFNRQTYSVSYLGPHSAGVICGKGTGLVELVLNNLQHGFDPALFNLDQSGCFCPW